MFCRLASAALVMVVGALPAAAGERPYAAVDCTLAPGETGRVEAAIDATTLRLEGGLEVRLAGLLVPATLSGLPDAALEAEAQAALADLASGQFVQLRYAGARRNRYGQATAQVFAGEVWLQAAMLHQGAALVAGIAADRACLAELLDAERVARAATLGIWRDRPPLQAEDASLRGVEGLYGLIEGRILSIGRTSSTVYLNFGRDWSTDLTVTIRAADARDFEAEGGSLDELTGTRVRVRGWLTQWDGPTIRVDHPEQIERLDTDDSAGRNGAP